MTDPRTLAEAERMMRADAEQWTRKLDLCMAAVLYRQAERLTRPPRGPVTQSVRVAVR
jgi:hypothetical protein